METYNSPEKINQPEITIEKDQETGMEIFGKYLFDVDDQYHRNMVLRCHKQLKDLDVSGNLTQEKVQEYLENLYEEKKEKIDGVIEESRQIIEKRGLKSLTILADYMDYDWRPEDKYKAIPTFLPHSPFNGHTFYFSMYRPVLMDKENEILDIAIHEISHFMLFQILKDLKTDQFERRENMGLLHLSKESLTGMLLSEPELGELLKRPNYKGNPETWKIFIQENDNEQKVFQEFLREKYKNNKENGGKFNDFIIEMMKILMPSSQEFSKRKKMWNEHGRDILDNPDLLKIYSQPIKI